MGVEIVIHEDCPGCGERYARLEAGQIVTGLCGCGWEHLPCDCATVATTGVSGMCMRVHRRHPEKVPKEYVGFVMSDGHYDYVVGDLRDSVRLITKGLTTMEAALSIVGKAMNDIVEARLTAEDVIESMDLDGAAIDVGEQSSEESDQ